VENQREIQGKRVQVENQREIQVMVVMEMVVMEMVEMMIHREKIILE
jgi:hypothetical protein